MPIIDGNLEKNKDKLYVEAKTASPDIVGEPFKDYVNNQITQRQKVHGSGFNGTNRSQKDLVYLNSRNAWVKMASSVQIGALGEDLAKDNPQNLGINQEIEDFQSEADKKLKRLGLNIDSYKGIKLAQEGVLFNGIWDNKTKTFKKGVASSSSKINNSVYGFGGTGFGLQPMPGITSFNIGHNNIGSIRTAQVQIRAHNDFQFDLISLLYIRLGFTMLIEWGNSMYLDNKGNLQKMGPTLIDNNKEGWFGQKGTSHLEFFNQIEAKRKQYNGNYDGFFGKITNFDYSFEPDGSYNITLTLVSMGDIVESFNLNTLDNGFTLSLGTERSINNELLNNNSILNKLYCLKSNLLSKFDIPPLFDEDGKPNPKAQNKNYLIQNTEKDLVIVRDATNEKTLEKVGLLGRVRTLEEAKFDDIFITFSYFLNIINDLVTYIGNKSDYSPQLIINTSNKNYCKSFNDLVSFNPQICFINNNLNIPEYQENFKSFGGVDFELVTTEEEVSEEQGINIDVGKIMNIYLNVNYLENTIRKKTVSGELLLFDFLNTICQDINNSLANVTQLKPTLQDDNILVIRDLNLDVKTGKNGKIITKDSTPLEIYGVNTANKNQSNFVKDFKFNTTISKNLANSMSIGATAGAQDISSYAQFFTNLNKGLIDRFKEYSQPKNPNFTLDCGVKKKSKPTFLDYAKLALKNVRVIGVLGRSGMGGRVGGIKKQVEEKPLETIEELLAEALELYSQWYNNAFSTQKDITGLTERFNILLSTGFNLNEAEKRANASSQPPSYFDPSLTNYEQGKYLYSTLLKIYSIIQEPSTTSLIGFIPMDVELTLDGISGMKIYNQLTINSSHLPSGYPDNIELVIIGVDHYIVNNRWETKIRTLTKPSSKNSKPLSISIKELNEDNDGFTDLDFNPLGTPLLSRMDDLLDPNGQIPSFAPIERDSSTFLSSLPQSGRVISGKTRDHYGVDIAARKGLKVYAVTSGTVKKPAPNPGGWGNSFVYIEEKRDSETLIHIYGHMDSYREELIDTFVKAGTVIGTVGDQGSPGSSHLHYEVRIDTYSRTLNQRYKNPVKILNEAYNPAIFPNAQAPVPFNANSVFKL